jgi:acetoin utilization deacetylase AcuC-like enzyme
MLLIHSPRCLDYEAPGHPERPARVRDAVALLMEGRHEWVVPEPCTEAQLLRVHHPAQLAAVRRGKYVDGDTPHFPQIYELARLAAGAAIQAAISAIQGRPAFSVMRPPGHHAERGRVMGFCYFNNIAVAVAEALHTHPLQRVAILDFDCHHGNGTEDIFLGDDRVRFISLHQSPCYPGTGLVSRKNCLNYPLPPGTGPTEFWPAFGNALEHVAGFEPDLLAVSAGFDSLRGDPITQMGLEVETFGEIGARIGALGLPTFAVLEGGYARELPQCVAQFVAGWEQAAA